MSGMNFVDIKPEIVEHSVKEEPTEYVEENQFNVHSEIPEFPACASDAGKDQKRFANVCSVMDEEKLIECVREYDHLYNPYNKQYRNQHMRIVSWSEIGKKLGFSGTECKEAWTKLRNSYTNARKRRQTKSGQEAKNISKWKFEEKMMFLELSRKAQGNFSLQSDSEDERLPESIDENFVADDDNVHDNAEVTPNIEGLTSGRQIATIETSPSPTAEPKTQFSTNIPSTSRGRQRMSGTRKRRFVKTSRNQTVQIMKENRHKRSQLLRQDSSESTREKYCALDDTELLFLSLAKTVKTLSPLEQTNLKIRISNIVFQAEHCELQQQADNYHSLSDSVLHPTPLSSDSSSPISSPVSYVDPNLPKKENSHLTTSNSRSYNYQCIPITSQFFNM